MLSDLKKVKDRIEAILKAYPETRDSDKLLWLAYNCKHNGLRNLFKGTLEYHNFKAWLLKDETPVFESLSRARRKHQEEQKCLAGNARHKRLDEADVMRQWAKGEIS